MSIARTVAEQLERASSIRRMFEIGIEQRQVRGAENVFDYSLGNPEVEPPEAVLSALRRVIDENRPHSHGYMPNAGFPQVRRAIADHLAERTGIPFTANDIIMTNGAAGAINVVLKSILDPGDETILLNPYFPEYRFYVENHGGRVITVETDENFQPDVARIAAAITPRTKALILNSPNNPTGAATWRLSGCCRTKAFWPCPAPVSAGLATCGSPSPSRVTICSAPYRALSGPFATLEIRL
jgi:aspartate aminotransferase